MAQRKQKDAKERDLKYDKQNEDIALEKPVLYNPQESDLVPLQPSMLDSLPWDD